MFNIKLLEEVESFVNLNTLNKLGSYAIHEIKIQNGAQVKSSNYKTYGMSREEQWLQPWPKQRPWLWHRKPWFKKRELG